MPSSDDGSGAQLEPGRGQRRDGPPRGVETRHGDALDVDVRREPVRALGGDRADDVAGRDLGPLPDRRVDAVEDEVEDAADDEAVRAETDAAADRGVDRRPGVREHVDPEVDGRRLVHRVERRVDEAALAPAGHGSCAARDRATHEVADRARVADRRAVEGNRRRRQVERRDLAHVGQQRRRRELDHRPLDRPVPGRLSQRGLGERERDVHDRLERRPLLVARRHDVCVVGLERGLLVAADRTDAARATTSGHRAAISTAVSGTSAA